MPEDSTFLPPAGGYEELLTYQKAVIIYDGTVFFVKKWLPQYGDRTVDQMVQAARSGKQNIVEGSAISATSKELEIKLTGTAIGSLDELKEDYQDFLRTRKLTIWPRDHRYARRFAELNRLPGASYADFQRGIEGDDPEIAANILLNLTKVTIFLLKKQLAAQQRQFLAEGGIRERMTRARRETFKKPPLQKPRDGRDQRDERDPRR